MHHEWWTCVLPRLSCFLCRTYLEDKFAAVSAEVSALQKQCFRRFLYLTSLHLTSLHLTFSKLFYRENPTWFSYAFDKYVHCIRYRPQGVIFSPTKWTVWMIDTNYTKHCTLKFNPAILDYAKTRFHSRRHDTLRFSHVPMRWSTVNVHRSSRNAHSLQ